MMSTNEMFIQILHILSLTQIVSPTCNNGWTDYTTCPAPLTPLADGIKQLKSDLSKLNCQVPPEFFSMGMDSAMTQARSTLAAYKTKNNITTTKVRVPKVITTDTSSRMKRQAVQPANSTTAAGNGTSSSTAGPTPAPPPPTMTGPVPPPTAVAPPPAGNGTASPPPAGNSTAPPLPLVGNATAPPPPPAGNSTAPTTMKPNTAPPLPPVAVGSTIPSPQVVGKMLRSRILSLSNLCMEKSNATKIPIDPQLKALADRIQQLLQYTYDSTVPNPSPTTLVQLFNIVNPSLQTFMKKLQTLNATQLSNVKFLATQWKSSLMNMMDVYLNASVILITNSSLTDMALKQMSSDFASYADSSTKLWFSIMNATTITDIPGLALPNVVGNTPSIILVRNTNDPCYVLYAVCTLVDNGLIDTASQFSSTELQQMPPGPSSGITVVDYSDTPYPDQAVVGCGFCYRKVRCCKGNYSNMLQQDITGDVCNDHCSACEVPPVLIDNTSTCDYVKTLPKPDFGSMPSNLSPINLKLYATNLQQQMDRLKSLINASVPMMNCMKIDMLCYCCCFAYQPVLDSEGYVVCQIYQPPIVAVISPSNVTAPPANSSATTTVPIFNVTTTAASAITTTKAANSSSNITATLGNVTQVTVGPVNQTTAISNATTTMMSNSSATTTGSATTTPTVTMLTTIVATTTNSVTTTKSNLIAANASVAKSLVESRSAILSRAEQPSAGSCFGSFSFPAQCSGESCTYQLNWKSMTSPKGLFFGLTAKVPAVDWWTGVGISSNSNSPEAAIVAYQMDGKTNIVDGYFDTGNELTELTQAESLSQPTVVYENGFLKANFIKTCQSFSEEFGKNFCNVTLFYFVPVKGGIFTELRSINFDVQSIVNGPLFLTGCFD